MRKVIFLHSKFPENSSEFEVLLGRWNEYGKLVSESNGDKGIQLFSISKVFSLQKWFFLYSLEGKYLTKRLLPRSIALSRVISSDDFKFTVVSGDNQMCLLFGLLLKLRFGERVRLQVQLHGNTYEYSANKSFVEVMRVFLSRIALRYADTVRIVSNFQEKEIKKITSRSNLNFVVAPIPINLGKIVRQRQEQIIDVVTVGRLQAERGIKEMVEIIKTLKARKPSLRIKIVGDGPKRSWIENELKLVSQDDSVSLTGYLSEDLLREVYAQSKVLLSTAALEGYGLTLREAALSGVNVVARSSSGSIETAEGYRELVILYQTPEEAVDAVLERLNKPSQANLLALRDSQMESDIQGLQRLVRSWTEA